MRPCNTCGKLLLLVAVYEDAKNADGYQSRGRRCTKTVRKQHYVENAARIRRGKYSPANCVTNRSGCNLSKEGKTAEEFAG